LLVTITLLAFLVLLLVSLASLTRVETRVASNNQSIAQARQNALLALNLALGQLQKHAGRDQWITARADVALPAGVTITATTTAADALAAIDAHWRERRNRQWTGVWLNANGDSATYDRNNPAAFNPSPAFQSWLVSGNENSADGALYKPGDVIEGLSLASTPLEEILDANGNRHRLLVKASAGVAAADTLDRAVTAPQIEIRSTASTGNSNANTLIGHYAWWIGDEGVKARANLADPYAIDVTAEGNRTRLQSAQRLAIEAMSTNGADGLGSLTPPTASGDLADYQEDLLNVFTPAQLTYLGTANAALPAELKARFHDFSVSSRGVLADPKNGGLKTDLGYVLARPDIAALRIALDAAYGTSVTPSGASNSVFSSLTTPYAILPANVSGAPAYNGATGIFSRSSTWEQLWSFYNLGNSTTDSPAGVFNPAGEVAPRRQNETRHGVHPLLIQAKLFYGLRTDGGTIRVDVTPVVVLANPYNVKLAEEDYVVRFDGFQPRVRFGTSSNLSDPGYTPAPNSTTTSGQILVNKAFTAGTRFVLRSTGMEAGKAYVFTIGPTGPGVANERFSFNTSAPREVHLSNDFYPLTAITYDTGISLPYTVNGNVKTHAALTGGSAPLTAALYIKSDYTGADDPTTGIHYVFGQATSDPSTSGLFFLVEPITAGGSKVGGGIILLLNEPPTGAPDNYRPQQAPFYQVNYRGSWINYSAVNSGLNHPVEWARAFTKHGSTAGGNSFNPWLGAHLLLRSTSDFTTRWGIVNYGSNAARDNNAPRTLVPESIGGASAGDVGFENYLYDLPRPDRAPASIGQLQHFNTTGFIAGVAGYNQGGAAYNANIVHAWQVNYPVANSYPHPRVPRDQLFFSSQGFSYHYDGSYLWNELLWDRFYFSSYPQVGSFDFATENLPHARYRPFRDRREVPWNDASHFRGDGNPATAANNRIAAQNLLVEGAFNINSTSVEAWKAVFSSLKNVPVGSVTGSSAPFARTLFSDSGSAQAETGIHPNSWTGFRDLTPVQVQALAEAMVVEVRKRGPFLSLAEFVNRRLIKSNNDPLGLGLRGALQAAIDSLINQRNDVAAPFNTLTNTNISTSPANALQENGYLLPNGLAGFPGHLLQSDVLSALGPTLAARSDTFTIRTYADTTNSATGEVVARAWCEAVVQRTPDYVVPANLGGNAPHETPAAGSINETFGRRFQIVSFRWLSPEDI
jgi:hypothetical protein